MGALSTQQQGPPSAPPPAPLRGHCCAVSALDTLLQATGRSGPPCLRALPPLGSAVWAELPPGSTARAPRCDAPAHGGLVSRAQWPTGYSGAAGGTRSGHVAPVRVCEVEAALPQPAMGAAALCRRLWGPPSPPRRPPGTGSSAPLSCGRFPLRAARLRGDSRRAALALGRGLTKQVTGRTRSDRPQLRKRRRLRPRALRAPRPAAPCSPGRRWRAEQRSAAGERERRESRASPSAAQKRADVFHNKLPESPKPVRRRPTTRLRGGGRS